MGLACKKNLFFIAIRSPLYCGKIPVEAYKDEQFHYVKGLHAALIREEQFNEVQEILNGRKRVAKTTLSTKDEYPLRGFITCPRCSRTLTASGSKGRVNYYHY